jgi:hypothetical protein
MQIQNLAAQEHLRTIGVWCGTPNSFISKVQNDQNLSLTHTSTCNMMSFDWHLV